MRGASDDTGAADTDVEEFVGEAGVGAGGVVRVAGVVVVRVGGGVVVRVGGGVASGGGWEWRGAAVGLAAGGRSSVNWVGRGGVSVMTDRVTGLSLPGKAFQGLREGSVLRPMVLVGGRCSG